MPRTSSKVPKRALLIITKTACVDLEPLTGNKHLPLSTIKPQCYHLHSISTAYYEKIMKIQLTSNDHFDRTRLLKLATSTWKCFNFAHLRYDLRKTAILFILEDTELANLAFLAILHVSCSAFLSNLREH